MALKNRILGWLRQTPEADEKLEEAEADLAEDAYQDAASDMRVDARLGRASRRVRATRAARGSRPQGRYCASQPCTAAVSTR